MLLEDDRRGNGLVNPVPNEPVNCPFFGRQ